MLRKTVFWLHLICGVAAGLVILMMSVTGVLLTYERQMLSWADSGLYSDPPPGGERLDPESLIAAVNLANPDFQASAVSFNRDPRAPATVAVGRGGSTFVNSYTGEVLGSGSEGMREFFGVMTGWHRWFNAAGDARGPARAITGASNLAFLFLVLTGMYLWLPPVFRPMAFKLRLLFNPKAKGGKARDYNWHHVFGIWSAVPLVVVVATAVVFSYGWANDLVYRTVGEEPPQRAGPPGGAARPSAALQNATEPRSLAELFAVAEAYSENWQQITLQLPADAARSLNITLDEGNGGQPQRRHTLVLDRWTGKVSDWRPFSSQSTGQRARSLIRFLHTGEALGLVGQTIAGLVSLASILMVWTGLALAYRRLIVPLFK